MDRALAVEALDLLERLRSECIAAAVRQNESQVARLTRLVNRAIDRYERRWRKTVCR